MTSYRAHVVPYLLTLFALSACGSDPKRPGESTPDAGELRDAESPGKDQPDAGEPDAQSSQDAGEQPDAAGDDSDAGPSDDAGALEPPRWYESKTALELSVTGPMEDAFEAAFAGTPDGIIPPVRNKDPVDGGVSYLDLAGTLHSASVELAVRGNSSLQECAFPKLKFAFPKRVEARNDVFFDTKKVKIGTHCGEEDAVTGTIGRLRHEKAAWREEVVYQLARALGITIVQKRPAIITYADPSASPSFTSPLTRKAFLLEHVDELARRLGAVALKDPVDCGDATTALPDANDVPRVKFFHAMIGNWDWLLGPPTTHGCGDIMNTEVLIHPDGAITLVPADFDLAAMVVGEIRNPDTNQVEAIEVENAAAAASAALDTSLSGESTPAIAAMKTAFAAKEAELHAIIDASLMDSEGKLDAKQMLDGFFSVLAR